MKNTLRKCIVARYDNTIKEPPYLTINIDEIEVVEPLNDKGGSLFADRLILACVDKGYFFKFYTSTDEQGYDYEIVVY